METRLPTGRRSRDVVLALAVVLGAGVFGCARGSPAESARAESAPPSCFDFEEAPLGELPTGFASERTGPGAAGHWRIEAGERGGGRVLAQQSTDAANMRFPLCVLEDFTAHDVSVSVRFQTVSGEVDRAAGLVVRYRDPGNYLVVRANALEGNVRLYTVIAGQRAQFAGAEVEVTTGEWHTLRLDAGGARFAVFLDGALLFTAEDDRIQESGKVGLWTKADSVTRFDELCAGPLPADSPVGRSDAR